MEAIRSYAGPRRGTTLVEMMLAVAIVSISVLGTISAFGVITKSVQTSKTKSLASNLAQEKIESLKNVSYFRLMATSATATDNNFDPALVYDGLTGYYPPEVPLVVGGISYDRRVYIRKVSEKTDGTLEYKSWSDADTGLKEVLIYVVWKQGSVWKKTELRNLRDDPSRQPVDSTFSGTVRVLGVPLAGARVEASQNTVWNQTTDASGNYSFRVSAGSYTLRASKDGYFSHSRAEPYLAKGDIRTTVDFTLVAMDSGMIAGSAYLRDHVVISQVVASTGASDKHEYVELYNPTTWAWTISDALFDLRYVNQNNVDVTDIALTFNQTSIAASGGYYLIANTGTVTTAGVSVVPDAVYAVLEQDVILKNKGGGLMITNDAGSTVYDKVAWTKNSAPAENAPAQATEGTAIQLNGGLNVGEQLVRSSVTFASINAAGGQNAWDSNVSSTDFNVGASPQDQNLAYSPKNSGTLYAPTGGTPVAGAVVSADDNLSASASADSAGAFTLLSVATGAWTLTVSSGLYYQTAPATVTANATVSVGSLGLSSSTANGYVSGKVSDALGANLSGIRVSGPGVATNTDSLGNFRLSVGSGSVQITANTGSQNASYTSEARTITVNTGQVAADTDFVLSQGGKIYGRSTSNGVDAYPGLVVIAKLGSVEQGSAVAGADGYFTIADLTTGTYFVSGYAESGESVSPSTFTTLLTVAGSTVWSGSFTVSGALGEVAGTVKYDGSSIDTGVLLVLSTITIVSDPPAITPALRSGTNLYYSGSSAADGTYSISVPGGFTYNVYAWYTRGGVTTRKNPAPAAVTAGNTTTKDLTWP